MMIDRLNYRISLKAYSPTSFGNEWLRSGSKSQVRTPVKSEKLRRAKVAKIRFTKLIRGDSLPLDGKCNITGKGLSLMWDQSRMYLIPSVIINYLFNKKLIPQRSKVTQNGEKGTMGSPKEPKLYGFGGFIVDVSRRKPGMRFYSSSSVIKPSGSDALKELREINRNFIVNTKIIHVIADIDILISAYETVKSFPGNMTYRGDGKILDGATAALLNRISSDLKAGKFNFSPARKVYTPKRNKDELKLLEVVSIKDKIVQTAVLMVLEAIFEPSFLNTSHGFRPEKGCHTALRRVKNTFSNIDWIIKGDLSKCHGWVDVNIFINILRKRINCEKTLVLIKKLVRNFYTNSGRLIYPKLGTSQESYLSFLFCNIALHEFDIFIEKLKKFLDKEARKTKNPVYRKLRHNVFDKKDFNVKNKRELFKKSGSVTVKNSADFHFRRLQYVRYAGDFLVGVTGKQQESIVIRQKIFDFLRDTLNLNLDEICITPLNYRGVTFLETRIKSNQETKKKVHLTERENKKIGVCPTSRVRLEAPINSIFEKGVENGFFKKTETGKFAPTYCGRLINLNHSDIIRFYNQKIRGMLNYYSFTDNKKSLGSFVHGLRHSCALTLALKFKFRYRSKVFKKFGTKLACPETKIELYLPETFSQDQKFSINPENPRVVMEKGWNNKFAPSNLIKSCFVCGKFLNETYHVRHVKTFIKSKCKSGKLDLWEIRLAAINHKQIPLCKEHRLSFHRGTLTEQEKEKLIEIVKAFK